MKRGAVSAVASMQTAMLAGGVLLLGAAAFWVWRRGGIAPAAAAASRAVVDAAGGVVVGVGQAFGVPETDREACGLAIAEGRMWDASFACPASRYMQAIGRNATGARTGERSVDQRILDRWDHYTVNGTGATTSAGSKDATDHRLEMWETGVSP